MDYEQQIEKEIELVKKDFTLTKEEKEKEIQALIRHGKEFMQEQFREVYRLDGD